jgi:erythromycin esterase-like protein
MPIQTVSPQLTAALQHHAQPLEGGPRDYDALLERIGDARFVLLGEASHGTHEFYRERAQITKRLIEEKGFTGVAVEADWPDAYQVNRYVRGESPAADSVEALGRFQRFPLWMWRNADVLDFVGWLRAWNERRDAAERAGFYGIDLYSLYDSVDEVLRYLGSAHPELAAEARSRYACFDHFREDPQRYGQAASFGLQSCEEQVVSQLLALQKRAGELLNRDGAGSVDAYFHAEQNARLAMNAERYYREMFRGAVESWNLRDTHMAETIDRLAAHLEKHGPGGKLVIWAHNSHLGDARATQMGDEGELNVGQLVRERHGGECFLVGFTTYEGSVTASSEWDGDAERKRVRPALPGSYEDVFHRVGIPRFLLPLRDLGADAGGLATPRLERAIGVIYRPESERFSHYFEARLPEQFDAVIHIDATRAVEPLERAGAWTTGEAPETFPTGM